MLLFFLEQWERLPLLSFHYYNSVTIFTSQTYKHIPKFLGSEKEWGKDYKGKSLKGINKCMYESLIIFLNSMYKESKVQPGSVGGWNPLKELVIPFFPNAPGCLEEYFHEHRSCPRVA